MSKDKQLQLRASQELKDKLQHLADTRYMSMTGVVMFALHKTYPELEEIDNSVNRFKPKPTPLEVTQQAVEEDEMPKAWKPRKPITKKDQMR